MHLAINGANPSSLSGSFRPRKIFLRLTSFLVILQVTLWIHGRRLKQISAEFTKIKYNSKFAIEDQIYLQMESCHALNRSDTNTLTVCTLPNLIIVHKNYNPKYSIKVNVRNKCNH